MTVGALGCQGEPWLDLYASGEESTEVIADCRPMFKSMAGTAPDQPDVVEVGVSVDKEVAVPGDCILADACIEQLGSAERRKTSGHQAPCGQHSTGRGQAITGVRIERRTMLVQPDLKAAPVEVRNPVNAVFEVDPGGHCRGRKASIPRLASEEKDLLPGGVKERPEHVRKQFGKPRTTRKNKRLGAQVITPERRQRLEVAAAGRGSDSVEAVIDAQLDRLLHECVDRTTCEDDTAVGFQHSSRDRSKLKLGKPSLEILTGEQLDVYTEPLQRQCRRVKQWILVAPKK